MTENFPNLERGKTTQVQEADRAPIRLNPKRPTPRNIIIKMPSFKGKEIILKTAREKQEVIYKAVKLATYFSTEALQA